MKYNKNTKTEKPINEMPHTCKECPFFEDVAGGCCKANGCTSSTFAFSRPADRPLPMPLNCYWWYANGVWNKVGSDNQKEYTKERLHLLTAWEFIKDMNRSERCEFASHLHRPGGGGLIDFTKYPEAFNIYCEIKKEMEE